MSARLDGNTVLVAEPLGSRLHGRHLVGDLGPKGLRLSLVEAAWCLLGGRLAIDGVGSVGELLGRSRDGQTEVDHLAYADLRERGLVVRHAGASLAVLPRGAGLDAPPSYTVRPFSERTPITAKELAASSQSVLALVDDDGAVTHYRLDAGKPEGVRPVGKLPPATGLLLRDRVLVEDPSVREAWQAEGIGVPHGAGLVLSLVEAEHLRRRGVLGLEGKADLAKALPDLDLLVTAYEAVRASGALCKSGFKFGTHFRAYREDPDDAHAEWLLQAVRPDADLDWSDLSRAIRLAHGVRKTFLLAVATKPVRFLSFSWFRP
jgi:tRNA-intron endonuclease